MRFQRTTTETASGQFSGGEVNGKRIIESIILFKYFAPGSGSSDAKTYGIRVTSAHALDHGHWEVKTKSGSFSDNNESEADGDFNVTIIKPPENIIMEPANINVKLMER